MSDTGTPSAAKVSSDLLEGRGLASIEMTSNLAGHLEQLEPHLDVLHTRTFENRIDLSVFEWTGGATRSHDFPGDELVIVLSGTSTLTDEGASEGRTFSTGERFIVPRGWRGVWRANGRYRELALTAVDPWEGFVEGARDHGADAPAAPAGRAPLHVKAIDLDRARAAAVPLPQGQGYLEPGPGATVVSTSLHAGELDVVMVEAPEAGELLVRQPAEDAFVEVLAGTVSVNGDGDTFAAGDSLVLPAGAAQRLSLSAGARAIVTTSTPSPSA